MENNISDITFDYYSSTTSYVKTIMDILPEEMVSKKKKAIITELFNYLLNNLSEEELIDVTAISRMFNQKLESASTKDILSQAEYLYKTFIEKMLFDSYNRELYFNIMNECVKTYVDYYSLNQNNNMFYELNDNEINNIRIK